MLRTALVLVTLSVTSVAGPSLASAEAAGASEAPILMTRGSATLTGNPFMGIPLQTGDTLLAVHTGASANTFEIPVTAKGGAALLHVPADAPVGIYAIVPAKPGKAAHFDWAGGNQAAVGFNPMATAGWIMSTESSGGGDAVAGAAAAMPQSLVEELTVVALTAIGHLPPELRQHPLDVAAGLYAAQGPATPMNIVWTNNEKAGNSGPTSNFSLNYEEVSHISLNYTEVEWKLTGPEGPVAGFSLNYEEISDLAGPPPSNMAKYGQCWVFAGTFIAMSRALGISAAPTAFDEVAVWTGSQSATFGWSVGNL